MVKVSKERERTKQEKSIARDADLSLEGTLPLAERNATFFVFSTQGSAFIFVIKSGAAHFDTFDTFDTFHYLDHLRHIFDTLDTFDASRSQHL